LKERKGDRDRKMKFKSFRAQLKAIHAWGQQESQDLSVIKQPVLVVNGDNDKMIPSQYHEAFVKTALDFLGHKFRTFKKIKI